MVVRSRQCVIAVAAASLVYGCAQPEERPLPGKGRTDPATVVSQYAQAINARSLNDYLVLHADGFVIERPDDGRDCLPWLDDAWWNDGTVPPECPIEPDELRFAIVSLRSDAEREEVLLHVESLFLVSPDGGWLNESQLILELAWFDDALLITRVVEPPF
jgi:hypothetical protein